MSEPTLEEALRQILDARASGLHVAIPGTVVKYDAARAAVDVLPGVRRPYPKADGTGTGFRDLPILPAVPVMWPGGSLGHVTWPVAPGDAVLVICADYDPAGWVSAGGVQTPEDLRTHSLAHGFAIPFRRGEAATAGVTELDAATFVHIGAGASDFVALASLVMTELGKIRTWANSHTHSVPGIVSGPSATTSAVPSALLPAASSVAATKAMAK